MSRVFLMADFGKGPQFVAHQPKTLFSEAYDERLSDLKLDGRRWWLVEAESAANARVVIASLGGVEATREHLAEHGGDFSGRILDSGGAA